MFLEDQHFQNASFWHVYKWVTNNVQWIQKQIILKTLNLSLHQEYLEYEFSHQSM